ncbi:probable G-protein coupled receptor 156 [Tachyglossus aculeatus]|uniref:probable G-protein coupled receptor 156 n=1 Tax=Tachyglossus aculeatus TaxID=9261 RepID=UPI0018F4C35B|nr:probable G-protein coupled receptor 156 [Tachyglossus aculeatus]
MEPTRNCSHACSEHRDLCSVVVTPSDDSGGRGSPPSLAPALRGVVWTLLGAGLLLTLFFLAFTIRCRRNRIVKMSSPNLNIVTLLGSGLTYSSAFLFGVQEPGTWAGASLETVVQTRLALLALGSSLIFCPILGKSWRLHKVFTQRLPNKRVIIKDLQLLGLVAALVLADAVLLATWTLSDPVRCLRVFSFTVRVSDRDLFCSGAWTHLCASRYADLWVVLILGSKGALLLVGAYVAGLTGPISSPPVNQSSALLAGIFLAALATGTTLLVAHLFPTWPNLLFGLTSGGIIICTTTVNCFVFLPQLRQWRAFDEESPAAGHLAKYFSSPSKSHPGPSSEDQIYSLKRLLSEKNAAIETLQDQVAKAKERLVRLMAAEGSPGSDAAPPAPSSSPGRRDPVSPPDTPAPAWHPPPGPEEHAAGPEDLPDSAAPRQAPPRPVPGRFVSHDQLRDVLWELWGGGPRGSRDPIATREPPRRAPDAGMTFNPYHVRRRRAAALQPPPRFPGPVPGWGRQGRVVSTPTLGPGLPEDDRPSQAGGIGGHPEGGQDSSWPRPPAGSRSPPAESGRDRPGAPRIGRSPGSPILPFGAPRFFPAPERRPWAAPGGCPDSESSSSSDEWSCRRAPRRSGLYCEVCFRRRPSSSDSTPSDADPDPARWPAPLVNFKEDLTPTLV